MYVFAPNMKIKRLILLVIGSLLNLNSFAQPLDWVNQTGDTLLDAHTAMAFDSAGYLYTVGYFESAIDIDPGPNTTIISSAGETDMFIQKLDTLGNLIWYQHFGSTGADRFTAIEIHQNHVFIVGNFENTVDFDFSTGVTQHTSAGNTDIILIKLDLNGNFIWTRQIGGIDTEEAHALKIDTHLPNENILIGGRYRNLVDFDPGTGTHLANYNGNSLAGFLLKLNHNGNFVFLDLNTAGGGGANFSDIEVDNNGHIFACGFAGGYFTYPTPFGTNGIFTNGLDAFVTEITPAGIHLTYHIIGGNGAEKATDIALDNNHNIIFSGTFTFWTEFYNSGSNIIGYNSHGFKDIFLMKLDSSQNFSWVKVLGSTGEDEATDIELDSIGNIYMTGYHSGNTDFNPGVYTHYLNATGQDIFYLKLNNVGSFEWAHSPGGSGDDFGNAILTKGDKLYACGGFSTITDFDLTGTSSLYTSAGLSDGYVTKFDLCQTTIGWLVQTICSGDSYTGPSGNYTWSSSGTYFDTIMNAGGCDSIIYVGLTVIETNDTIYESVCQTSYTSPSGNYVWTTDGTYTDTLVNTLGCDSLLTVNLSFAFPDSIVVNAVSCDSLVSPSGLYTWTVSGIYDDTLTNIFGCDSIVQTHLTVTPPTVDTIQVTAIDNYTLSNGTTYTSPGFYNDSLLNMNECDSIIVIDLSLDYTSIEENQLITIKIYPNPTKDFINISGLDQLTDIKACYLTDSNGKVKQTLDPQLQLIDVSNLSAGFYILHVEYRQGTRRVKLIKH